MDVSTMTQARWDSMSPAQRDNARDLSGLTPQLRGLEGCRVEVVDRYDDMRRFWVGRSSGWRPCHIEVHNTRSMGGPAVTGAPFKSIRVIRRGR